MLSRNMERLGGAIIFSISGGLFFYNWYLISSQKYWYPKAMSFAVAFMILGLAMIIFPSYRRERIERGENIDTLQGLSLLTPKWRVVLIVSIVAAIANFIYVQFFY